MDLDLKDKGILVVGGTSGMGLAAARTLAGEGASLVLVGRDFERAQKATSAYSIRAPELVRLPYTALKSSVAVLTKGIAKAYGKDGIRANCVCPGAIETEPLQALRAQLAKERGWPLEEALERVMTEEWGLDIALGRPGQPQEVGELITFLLSPRAGYLTGALLNIDGGTNF